MFDAKNDNSTVTCLRNPERNVLDLGWTGMNQAQRYLIIYVLFHAFQKYGKVFWTLLFVCSVLCIKEPRLFWPYPDFKSQFANFEQASNIKWDSNYPSLKGKNIIRSLQAHSHMDHFHNNNNKKVEVMTVNKSVNCTLH